MRYVFDDCILDTDRHTLVRQGQPVRLQPRVFRMLAYLLEHHRRVVPHQELFEQVWQGQYVGKATLDGCIKQVRQAIGDSGRRQRLLKTQHGVGYQLVTPVRVQDAAETEPDISKRLPPEPVVSPPSVPPPRLAERRQLTVLSGALADALYLFGHLDADDLHRVLRAFHSLCADTVSPFGGTVAQRIDDHCVIYFGYPQAHGDDARHAVLAALHLLESVRSGLPELAPWLEGTGGIKVGIHTGEVVIDNEDDGSGVLVLGSVATVASVLREVAEPQTVVISADTASLTDGYFSCQSLAPVMLPGRRDVMPMYRVTGASGAQMRLDLLPARGLTPFVGRKPELSLLTARWGQARDGRGQAVLISGEAGIGKSRLLRTVAEKLVEGDAVEGRGSPYHQQSAFYALTEMLRHLLQLNAYSGGDPVGQCEDVLHQYGLGAERHLPFIAPLLNLSLPPERYPASPLSPQQKRQRTFESLLAIVLGASKPLSLMVEDLHWVDPSTLAWLSMLLEQLPTAEVLLLMTCRPEFKVPWASRSYLTQVTLDRLETTHSRRMVESIVQNRALPPPLIEQIIAHSDGVPLFIEELSRAVLDTGETRIPMTLQDTLTARLDQVGEAKRTVQLGAVLGRQFSDALLRAVSPLEEADLRRDLRALIDSELLYQRGMGEEATYQFKHALIQDAAYGSLLRRTRQQLHRKIAQVLETRFPQTKDTQPELLAHHFTEAGIYEPAFAYYRRAGKMAWAQSASHEASQYFEQALLTLSHLPDSPTRHEQAIDLCFDLSITLIPQRENKRALDALREAERLAKTLDDQHRLGQASYKMSVHLRMIGDYDAALVYGQRTRDIAIRLGNLSLQVAADFVVGQVYHTLGNYRSAIELHRRALSSLQKDRFYEDFGWVSLPPIECRVGLVLSLAEVGAFAEGIAVGEEALQMAETIDRRYERLTASLRVSILHLLQGNVDKAMPLLKQSLTLSQETNLPRFYNMATSHLAVAYAQCGRIAEALPLARNCEGLEPDQLLNSLFCIEAYLLIGHVEAASQLALHTLKRIRTHNQQGHEARALWLLGEIAMQRDPPDLNRAVTHYQQALALAGKLGMHPLVAHCHHSLGMLYSRTGQREQAGVNLSTAIALYRSMGMVFWLPQAKDALANVRDQDRADR